MYRVLLVEDIDLIRKDIREMIEWKLHGYQIVGEGRNGEQGLSLYRLYSPDIVITDIRMPIMNGLEMIEQILRLNPNAQFILLTAYEEFDYAKKAISLGISSYLLKHELDESQLLSELNKVSEKLEETKKISLFSRTELLRKVLVEKETALSLLSEDFFPWTGQTHFLLLQPSPPSGKLYWDYPLFLKRTKEIFPPDVLRCYMITGDMYILFINTGGLDIHKEEEYMRRIFHFIQTAFFQLFQAFLSAAVSPPLYSFQHLETAFCQTKLLLEYKIFFKESCLLFSSMIQPISPSHRRIQEEKMVNFSNMLKKKEFTLAADLINTYLCSFPVLNLDLYHDLITHVTQDLANLKDPELPPELLKELWKIQETIHSSTIFSVSHKLYQILNTIHTTLMPQYSRKVEQMIRYIQLHYKENISLQDLSDALGLSPLYVSQLFKKEVGITLMSYIAKYRIQIASQLLKSGKYKIYEVSEMVGYTTVQYFSSCFRKETGKKPSDYC